PGGELPRPPIVPSDDPNEPFGDVDPALTVSRRRPIARAAVPPPPDATPTVVATPPPRTGTLPPRAARRPGAPRDRAPPERAPPEPPIAMPTDDDLREAVGVSRRDRTRTRAGKRSALEAEHGDDTEIGDAGDDAEVPLTPEDRARRRRRRLVLAPVALVRLGRAALVSRARASADRLVFHGAADAITARGGRSSPPWGTSALGGPEWAPIAIPAQAECTSRETDDRAELERWYLDALVEQASAKLS